MAVDCGIKYNIIRQLNAKGCNVTVVPYNTTLDEIMAFNPDGIFLSNARADPENVPEVGGAHSRGARTHSALRHLSGATSSYRWLTARGRSR